MLRHRCRHAASGPIPGLVAVLSLAILLSPALSSAQPLLLDPLSQPKFVNDVPDALDPGFLFQPTDMGGYDYYEVGMYQVEQPLGLVDPVTGEVIPLDLVNAYALFADRQVHHNR